jgi:hypothetical protein
MTEVVVHLSIAPRLDSRTGAPITGESDFEPGPFEASLEAAMDSLRDILEGAGGEQRR